MSDILGLSSYYKKNGTNYLLAVLNQSGDSSDLLYYDESSWTLISGGDTLPTDARVEFAGFLDYAFIVGATTADSPTWVTTSKLNGTTYTTSGTDLDGAPKARYIKVWRDLLWLGNLQVSAVNYPNRIFYSNDVTAGAITWTSTNWIDIDVDDGDKIMGLGINSDRLLIFKEFSLYRYDENSIVKTDNPGTTAHRTIKNLRGYTFYANRDGIYRFNGVVSELISGPMKPLFEGMTSSPYNMCAEVDDDNYRLFIGNTVVEGITHTNVWINYSLSLDSWFPDKTADKVLVMTNFIDSSDNKRIYFGTDSTTVYKKADRTDQVYSDQYVNTSSTGVPIQAEIETKNYDMGVPDLKKKINRISLFLDQVQGMKVNYSIDDGEKKQITALKKPISSHDFNGKDAHWINFLLTENSKNPPFSFNGFVVEVQSQEDLK